MHHSPQGFVSIFKQEEKVTDQASSQTELELQT